MATNIITPITRPALPPVSQSRTYPHVAQVTDHATKQSLQLAWDQLHDKTAQATALQAQVAALEARVASLEAKLSTTQGVVAGTAAIPITPDSPA